MSQIEKIKNSFYALNFVFTDSLEYSISSEFTLIDSAEIKIEQSKNSDIIHSVNKKLLFADELSNKTSPGIVSFCKPERHRFNVLLNNSLIRGKLFEEHKNTICEKLKNIIDIPLLKKTKIKIEKDIFDELKKDINKTSKTIEVNVTPICDFVQNKEEYSRIIPGLLIENKFKKYVDTKSEALFISPDFKLNISNEFFSADGIYFLLLDLRFFTSFLKSKLKDEMSPILRTRQQLLTEIQSKLSRHINRQGILFLEENE